MRGPHRNGNYYSENHVDKLMNESKYEITAPSMVAELRIKHAGNS